jgi:uncharacterized membrane protein
MSSSTGRGELDAPQQADGRRARWRGLSVPQLRAWALIAAACILIGYQLVAYWTLSHGAAGAWVVLVPLLAAAAVGWRTRWRWPLLALALGVGMWLWVRPGRAPAALLAVHVSIYLGLLWLFARTLRQGREPLVTGIARRVRGGTLPPEVVGYTRRATQAWCIFFACMATASTALFVFAPLPVWSLFANLLNLPLVAMMFLAEYCVRIMCLPHLQHSPITAAARAFRTGERDVPPG